MNKQGIKSVKIQYRPICLQFVSRDVLGYKRLSVTSSMATAISANSIVFKISWNIWEYKASCQI